VPATDPPRDGPEIPPDLPPEYVEAYLAGFERGYAGDIEAAAWEPSDVAPERVTESDAGRPAKTDRPDIDRLPVVPPVAVESDGDEAQRTLHDEDKAEGRQDEASVKPQRSRWVVLAVFVAVALLLMVLAYFAGMAFSTLVN
jgi:hypothetical protein